MTKKYLVLVESPNKCHSISAVLGSSYTVMASAGHITKIEDTGKYNLGIDVDTDFTPHYVTDPGKKDIVKKLKAAVKDADMVFLCSDPDREGEAISYHLRNVLGLKKGQYKRATFHEITAKGINEGLKNASDNLDENMAQAALTRASLDKICGYRLSGFVLSSTGGKSAGRVQGAALRLLSDRENEITKFIPDTYYEIYLPFIKNSKTYEAKFKGTDAKKMVTIKDLATANQVIKDCKGKEYSVKDITSKDRYVNANEPFTTSTFQQAVASKLGYSSKRAMEIAQKLFEGMKIGDNDPTGLISYHRTDSTRLADDFVAEAKKVIESNYGSEYYHGPAIPKKKLATETVQDAHEAIRVTHLEYTPEVVQPYLAPDEYKVYTIIYNRVLASLMNPAQIRDTEVTIRNGNYNFGIIGHTVIFDGYLKIYGQYSKDDEDDSNIELPTFTIGEKINAKDLRLDTKQTTPPARYTEASLVKKMEETGIGRPSTFASTIETLKDRKYMELTNRSITVTELGMKVNNLLAKYFKDIINIEYTAQMEKDLDEIADGKKTYLDEVKTFYTTFNPLVLQAAREANKDKPKPVETDKICPKCGAKLVIRKGKYGDFLACSRFPKCRYTEKIAPTIAIAKKPAPIKTDVKCPLCADGYMVARKNKKGETFYGCSNYPKCKKTMSEKEFQALEASGSYNPDINDHD
jgi:DNA topoisomerase-1